jgi:hypothetical protein
MKRIIQLTIGLALLTLFISGHAFADDIPHSFEAGTPVSASEMNENFQALIDLIAPIGTVIASMLTPVQMNDQAGGTWVLADGSAAPAAYASATGKATLPDLRGAFLRGLNEGRNDGQEDPDGGERTIGDYQGDQFQGHYHDLGSGRESETGQGYITAGTGSTQGITDAYNPITDGTNGTPRYGSETRPKNVAVYYYVKVK